MGPQLQYYKYWILPLVGGMIEGTDSARGEDWQDMVIRIGQCRIPTAHRDFVRDLIMHLIFLYKTGSELMADRPRGPGQKLVTRH